MPNFEWKGAPKKGDRWRLGDEAVTITSRGHGFVRYKGSDGVLRKMGERDFFWKAERIDG